MNASSVDEKALKKDHVQALIARCDLVLLADRRQHSVIRESLRLSSGEDMLCISGRVVTMVVVSCAVLLGSVVGYWTLLSVVVLRTLLNVHACRLAIRLKQICNYVVL